jgi:tRNA uridine 5-carbamoylmethylation protein Kti12
MVKNLWEIAEKINEKLPGDKNKRFILYGSNPHTLDKKAYIFEKTFNEETMTFIEKMHKFFFLKNFHETKNKPLIKLDYFTNIDYVDANYIQPMQKDLENIAKEFSKEYGLQYFKSPAK